MSEENKIDPEQTAAAIAGVLAVLTLILVGKYFWNQIPENINLTNRGEKVLIGRVVDKSSGLSIPTAKVAFDFYDPVLSGNFSANLSDHRLYDVQVTSGDGLFSQSFHKETSVTRIRINADGFEPYETIIELNGDIISTNFEIEAVANNKNLLNDSNSNVSKSRRKQNNK